MNVEAALRRIYLWIACLGAAGTIALLIWKGWKESLGFAVGSAVAGLNFHWIKGAADTLMAKFTSQPDPQPPKRVAAKFALRYALIGAAGYVIFKYLRVSLAAFLGGLLVVAAAIMAEIIYELSLGTPNGT
jgi:hypothetical protein